MNNENSYLTIAKLYKQLSNEFFKLSQTSISDEDYPEIEFTNQDNLSKELFLKLVNLYLDETKRKHALNLKRKSGVLLAKKTTELYIDFFNTYLPEFYTASESEDNPSFIVIKNVHKVPVAIIRFITDLGYQRGADFGEQELQEISEIASKLGIPQDNIFVVIASMINSLSESDVKSVLCDDKMTNKKLLGNPEKLRYYTNQYILSFSKVLNNPEHHIFIWSYELHPNVVADELYDHQKSIQDYNLASIEDVVTPILAKIKVYRA